MGRVRNKLVKRSSRQIIEKYYSKLTFDFDTNKRLMATMADTPSKRVRNQIAGFMTHLMKRIQRGPVKGISLRLQEEERERRMDYIPEKSAFEVDAPAIDKDTQAMLKSLNMSSVPVTVENAGPAKRVFKKPGQKFQKKTTTA